MRSRDRQNLVFGLSFTVTFRMVFSNATFRRIQAPFHDGVYFHPSLHYVTFVSSRHVERALNAPGGEIMVLYGLEGTRQNMVIICVHSSRHRRVRQYQRLNIGIRGQDRMYLFRLRFNFFKREFQL